MIRAFLWLVGILCIYADTVDDFGAWKQQYDITYTDAQEELRRFDIWTNNLALVEQHNREAAAGLHTFTLGMTQFAHYTNEEYKDMLTGLKPTPAQDAEFTVDVKPTLLGDTPRKWDWRDENVVTPVQDQGSCGSCWAFSAVASMEGRYALDSGNLQKFSEQEIVDCTLNGACTCDLGGEMHDGILEIANNHGGKINTELQYRYKENSLGVCRANDQLAVDAHITGYANVTHGNETALEQAILTYPGISVGIDASQFSFQMYIAGVYYEKNCKSDIDDLDHGVTLVGYGFDIQRAAEYWIVKNSWGKLWGEHGYIRMAKDRNNNCGIATDACFALSPNATQW